MDWDSLQQFLRTGAQVVAGILMGKGYMNAEGAELMSGAILSLAAFGWWLFWWVNKPKDA